MNCCCNPPKPAVVKTVTKPGPNIGRDFFCCESLDETKCNLFHWVGAHMPASLSNSSRIGNRQTTAAVRKAGQTEAKIGLWKIEPGSPCRIWFTIACPLTSALTKFYTNLDVNLRQYQNTMKMWAFDFTVYETVVSKIKIEFEDIAVVELPKFLVNGLNKYLAAAPKLIGEEPVLNLEPTLLEALLPFQLAGIRFVVKQGGRALIADEMGCGKTLQAIGVLQHFRRHWPALILMPVILTAQWKLELLKFCGELLQDKDIFVVKKASDTVTPGSRVVIVPYSIVDKLVERNSITPQQFGMVIADESHNLKSIDAKRTASAIPFLKQASVAVCLTGTPALNRPIELFTQLSGILPNVFSDYAAFGSRYCDAKPSRFGANVMEYKGASNEGELNLLLEGIVMIRRTKDQVIQDMPLKNRELRYVDADQQYVGELTKMQKRQTVLDIELKKDLSSENKTKLLNEQRQLLLRYYQTTGMCKIKAIREELFRLIDEARVERGKAESTAALKSAASSAAASEVSNSTVVDLSSALDTAAAEPKKQHSILDDDTVELVITRSNSIETNEDSEQAVQARSAFNSPACQTLSLAKSVESTIPPGAVIMELEEDLMSDKLAAVDVKESSNNGSADNVAVKNGLSEIHKHDAEEELCDSDDEIGVGSSRRKRLMRGSDKVTSSPRSTVRKSEVESWAPSSDEDVEDEECGGRREFTRASKGNRRSKSADGRKRAKRSSSDDYFQDECEDDEEEEEEEEEEGSVLEDSESEEELFTAPRGKRKLKASAASAKGKKRSGLESPAARSDAERNAFDEMVTAAASAVKSKRKKATAASASSPVREFSGLGKKVIVFAHHKSVMDAIEGALQELDVLYIRIDGEVSGPARTKLIKKFQDDDATDVALLSVTACGTGLNLTRANVALFGELYWSPGVVLQAEDRIHRLGQKADSVKIIYMVARNTADDIVWDQIQKKHHVLNATVGIDKAAGGAGGMAIKKQNEKDTRKDSRSYVSGSSSGNQVSLDAYYGSTSSGGGSAATLVGKQGGVISGGFPPNNNAAPLPTYGVGHYGSGAGAPFSNPVPVLNAYSYVPYNPNHANNANHTGVNFGNHGGVNSFGTGCSNNSSNNINSNSYVSNINVVSSGSSPDSNSDNSVAVHNGSLHQGAAVANTNTAALPSPSTADPAKEFQYEVHTDCSQQSSSSSHLYSGVATRTSQIFPSYPNGIHQPVVSNRPAVFSNPAANTSAQLPSYPHPYPQPQPQPQPGPTTVSNTSLLPAPVQSTPQSSAAVPSLNGLSEEVLQRIERNRLAALEKKRAADARRLMELNGSAGTAAGVSATNSGVSRGNDAGDTVGVTSGGQMQRFQQPSQQLPIASMSIEQQGPHQYQPPQIPGGASTASAPIHTPLSAYSATPTPFVSNQNPTPIPYGQFGAVPARPPAVNKPPSGIAGRFVGSSNLPPVHTPHQQQFSHQPPAQQQLYIPQNAGGYPSTIAPPGTFTFSTGRGSSVSTTEQHQQRANMMFSDAQSHH